MTDDLGWKAVSVIAEGSGLHRPTLSAARQLDNAGSGHQHRAGFRLRRGELPPRGSRDQLAELISKLKQQRDELALQMHLGKEEAKDQLAALTDK